MTELKKPWGDKDIFDWYISDECEVSIMVPLGQNGKALEIVSALYTIREAVKKNDTEGSLKYLNLLTELMIAGAIGDEDIITELEEKTLMDGFESNFDDFLASLLNEEESN